MRSVVITGAGVISSLGNSPDSVFAAAMAGHCGITTVSDVEGEMGGEHLEARVPDEQLDRVTSAERSSTDRSVLFSMNAARAAWIMAGEPEVDPEDLAVSISAGLGGLVSMRETLTKQRERRLTTVRASTVPRIMPNAVAARVAIDLNARAGAYSPISACASGLDAMALAYGLVATGAAEVVVAGGSEAVLDPLTVMGFGALRALSTNTARPDLACRPFDRQRDGFVLAEGAAVVVIESAEHARRRDAPVLCTLEGVGVTSDAYHLVSPEPTGVMAAGAMRKALRSAGRSPAEVSGVYAHATGTTAGDRAEARALHRVFADDLPATPVTGLKSMVGHLVGASGPLAAVVAAQALRHRVLTPTPNFESTDVDADLDVVLNVVGKEPRELDGDTRLLVVNAFGFGGQNVSIVLSDTIT